jgi:hypothetical protein
LRARQGFVVPVPGTLGVELGAGAEVVLEPCGVDVPPAGAGVDEVPPLCPVPEGEDVVAGVDLVDVD